MTPLHHFRAHSSDDFLVSIPVPGHRGLVPSLPLPPRAALRVATRASPLPPLYQPHTLQNDRNLDVPALPIKLPLDLFPRPNLDGEEGQRISPGTYSSTVRHAHSLYFPCSLLVPSLIDKVAFYLPLLQTAPACLHDASTIRKLIEGPLLPILRLPANTVSLVDGIG